MYTYLFGQRHLELRFPPFAWFLRIRENNMVTPKKEQGREGKKERKKPRRHATHRVCVCVCMRVCTPRSYVHSKNKNIFLRQPVQNKSQRTKAPLSYKSLLSRVFVLVPVSIAIRNISLFSRWNYLLVTLSIHRCSLTSINSCFFYSLDRVKANELKVADRLHLA